MDTNTQPADDLHDALLGEARHLIGWLIGELAAALSRPPGQDLSARMLRWTLRHLLVPAEALMRRALRLLMADLPPEAPKAPAATRPAPSRNACRREAQPRRPVFRLTEPPVRPRTVYLPPDQRPRISVPGLTPLIPAKAGAANRGPGPAALEAKLQRRLAALQDAYANPMPLARRLLRLRTARPDRPKLTLAYTRPPGFHTRGLAGPGRDIYHRLNETALAAELRFPDSS